LAHLRRIKTELFALRQLYFDGSGGKVTVTGNTDFNKIQYGTYISAGYNTINLYAYYGLNSLFKSAQVNGEPVNVKA
jgi:hypothetical protein